VLISLIVWWHLWELHLHLVVVALQLIVEEVRVESLLGHLIEVGLRVQQLRHTDLRMTAYEIVLTRVTADRHRSLVQVIRRGEAGL
jgi:hypothetical protein